MIKANVCLADGTNNNLPLLVYTEIQLQCNNMLYALQLAVADLSWKKDHIWKFGQRYMGWKFLCSTAL